MICYRLALAALVLAATEGPVFAATEPPTPAPSDTLSEEAVIPKAPSAPPKLLAPKRIESFGCDRYFTYQGRRLTCDSDVRRDAENLRVVVRDVPAAVAELDTYDYNRARVKTAAYFGTAGLLVGILGAVVAPHLASNPNSAITYRSIGVTTGLAILAGTFIYGYSVIQANESHIGTAVADYNTVHPEAPIELQFSTGISF